MEGEVGEQKGRSGERKRKGDKIGRNGSEREGRGNAHLLILQAPQAENCSRVVFGWASFWARREVEEEELSEGEPELCLMGIIVKKRKRETEERERKMKKGGEILVSLSGRPLCIQPRP